MLYGSFRGFSIAMKILDKPINIKMKLSKYLFCIIFRQITLRKLVLDNMKREFPSQASKLWLIAFILFLSALLCVKDYRLPFLLDELSFGFVGRDTTSSTFYPIIGLFSELFLKMRVLVFSSSLSL